MPTMAAATTMTHAAVHAHAHVSDISRVGEHLLKGGETWVVTDFVQTDVQTDVGSYKVKTIELQKCSDADVYLVAEGSLRRGGGCGLGRGGGKWRWSWA